MLDSLCASALHAQLSVWHSESRRGNASLIELLNNKECGWRRYICMFWFLIKTICTYTHIVFAVKDVKVWKKCFVYDLIRIIFVNWDSHLCKQPLFINIQILKPILYFQGFWMLRWNWWRLITFIEQYSFHACQ